MKKNLLALLALSAAAMTLAQCTAPVMVPHQEKKFVNIYKPDGDKFFGPDTKYLKEGQWYDQWVANDHTFVRHTDGSWHIFGITHPLVLTDPLSDGIHDGEYASFHAVSPPAHFHGTLGSDYYADKPKVLPPSDRPGEILPNHAPYIFVKDEVYHMIYGHSPIRMATSADLYKWTPQGELFSDKDGARDPNILLINGTYHLVYCSLKCVKMVTSKDLKQWSEPKVILRTNKFDPESPSLISHNGRFYLFVCSWDGNWDKKEVVGAYQNKTYVYQSEDPSDFGTDNEQQITTLLAHAPEIFQDEHGDWFISSAEWPARGVSVDRFTWE